MILRHANTVMNGLVLCAILLFAAVPGPASAHQDDHEPAGSASLHDAPVHQSSDEAAGHCHPGLDCFTAAVFVLPLEITPPAFVATAEYLTPFQMVDDVRPDMDLPPPRQQS